jgi:uncharacterized membrane protein
MQRVYFSARTKLGLALGASSLASLSLYFASMWAGHSGGYGYLPWNLLLAWVALLGALWLERTLDRTYWSSWYGLFVTGVWLVFVPNAFYMVSDFVHLQEAGKTDLLFDVVMFTSFILNGVILGFMSVFLVHGQLIKRISGTVAGLLVGIILFLCSFGIYIGRELRWNTWDLITHPSSVLFDVSDRVLKPYDHPQAVTTTASFFVLLGSLYVVLWYAARAARAHR